MKTKTGRFVLFAEVFAALAHPKRLEIVHCLGEGSRNAGDLSAITGLSRANLSQHLHVLKARGLVHCEKIGTFCHYRLTSPDVLRTCEIIRKLILDQMEVTSALRRQLAAVTPIRKRSL